MHNLMETTKELIAADGKKIELDGAAFLTLTLGNATSSQQVYVTPQATCLLLSQKARNELRVGLMYFPAQLAETSQMAECTDMDTDDHHADKHCTNTQT